MKVQLKIFLLAIALAGPGLLSAQTKEYKYAADVPENITTPDHVKTEFLGDLNFVDGMPSDETVKKVYDHLDFSRGVESFLQGIPATSIFAFLEGLKEAGVDEYAMGITENLLDARGLLLTPNTTTVYLLAEIDVKNGPVVMEVPPAVLGLVDDAQFLYLTDLGFTGEDKGQGGKYVFAFEDYDGELPEGHFIRKTSTYRHWVLMRAFVIDGNLEATIRGVKDKWRMYPLSEIDIPREPKFVNLSGVKFNTVHANNEDFYDELNAVVQYEPGTAFNEELVGLWAQIGIKKGKEFAPDARMAKILKDAAAVGNATARALTFRPRYEDAYFYEDRNWYTSFIGGRSDFTYDGELNPDFRTMFHYNATGITPAMSMSAVGQGSAYLYTAHDEDNAYLEGSKTYKVTLSADVPAKDFWSFVVYSTQHRCLLETDQKLAGLDSKSPDLKQNDDGTYSIYFSPEAPKGKEGNWVQTIPGKGFSVIMRLYGPLEPWMDKSWKPSDMEIVEE